MAKPIIQAGNKVSLRQNWYTIVRRLDWVSGLLGTLGDMLSSTVASIFVAGLFTGFATIGAILYAMHGNGLGNIKGVIVPFVLVIIGIVLLALNILMINPSQGSQLIISVRYWFDKVNKNTNRKIQKLRPFAFTKLSSDNDIVETWVDGNRYYFGIIKVQGKVSQTSFEEDLQVLTAINRDALKALERDTMRTTINFIGKPNIKTKVLAENATPEMQERVKRLELITQSMKDIQTLETYIVLSATNYRVLRIKINNQFKQLNAGLVTTAYQLKKDEVKKVINKLL